ncbi:hypothetical protein [Tateyamaria sp.]|uniref:hypothetical protein n=1 Tax=Tateyamaria sp. TaxID=1929288 RepID=UPI0032A0967B
MPKFELSHNQLLCIGPSWYWMVSDRVAEFDDFLLRPIRNIELVRAETRRWFDRSSKIDPGGSDKQVSDLAREILGNLADGGEDVMRFYEWGRALDNDMLVTVSHYQEHNDGSVHPVTNDTAGYLATQTFWIETLGYWRPDVLAFENRDGPDMRDTLYASYEAEVLEPWRIFKQRIKDENKAWMKMSRRRTEWDNYLWDKWFDEFRYDPAGVARDGYLAMKTREWWREISPTVSRNQMAQLLKWHKQAAHARDQDGFLKPDQIGPLNKALMIDDIPPFYIAAARPKDWAND